MKYVHRKLVYRYDDYILRLKVITVLEINEEIAKFMCNDTLIAFYTSFLYYIDFKLKFNPAKYHNRVCTKISLHAGTYLLFKGLGRSVYLFLQLIVCQ